MSVHGDVGAFAGEVVHPPERRDERLDDAVQWSGFVDESEPRLLRAGRDADVVVVRVTARECCGERRVPPPICRPDRWRSRHVATSSFSQILDRTVNATRGRHIAISSEPQPGLHRNTAEYGPAPRYIATRAEREECH